LFTAPLLRELGTVALTQRHSIAPGKKPPTQPGVKNLTRLAASAVPPLRPFSCGKRVGLFLKIKGTTKSPAVEPGRLEIRI